MNASTADITATQCACSIYGAASGKSFAPSFAGTADGSTIIVERGAEIKAPAPQSVPSGCGSVMLFGDIVENDGQIETSGWQTVLAAGQDFILRPGYSTSGNQTATVLGSHVATTGGTGSVITPGSGGPRGREDSSAGAPANVDQASEYAVRN